MLTQIKGGLSREAKVNLRAEAKVRKEQQGFRHSSYILPASQPFIQLQIGGLIVK